MFRHILSFQLKYRLKKVSAYIDFGIFLKSLDYFTTNFSPYPWKQIKIVEFPRYALYGEAFPGVIPISDKINQYIKKRLDNYLRGRARETEKEVPLALTNYETTYLHYEKGMVVMHALQDYIGEDRLNNALAVFDADNEPLYLKKHWVKSKTGELEFVVDRVPVKAGIDPYYFLVDKHTEDNVVDISPVPGDV
ncbi:MAG: hypothetical protein PVH61_28115 [Candidatus Aminicenantes bacterium]|jgi:hypothetical protein